MHANIGVEKYFFEAGDRILNRIKDVRNTAILPERTGPIADVLYSAAGNSADEHWYNRGVIAYSFETGADRFGGLEQTTLSVASAAGATAVRVGEPEPLHAAREGHHRPGPADGGDADGAIGRRRRTRTSPAPNIIFTQPLQFAHAAGAVDAGPGPRTVAGSASSRTTPPRAASRRSSSRPATTACSSRPTSTRRTTRGPR